MAALTFLIIFALAGPAEYIHSAAWQQFERIECGFHVFERRLRAMLVVVPQLIAFVRLASCPTGLMHRRTDTPRRVELLLYLSGVEKRTHSIPAFATQQTNSTQKASRADRFTLKRLEAKGSPSNNSINFGYMSNHFRLICVEVYDTWDHRNVVLTCIYIRASK